MTDLRPLLWTKMNDTLHLDAAEAEAQSPALLSKRDFCGFDGIGQQ